MILHNLSQMYSVGIQIGGCVHILFSSRGNVGGVLHENALIALQVNDLCKFVVNQLLYTHIGPCSQLLWAHSLSGKQCKWYVLSFCVNLVNSAFSR